MTFDFDLTDELKIKMKRLLRRDKKKVETITKKIKEIISNDKETIDRYKNLRYELKTHKRVHIDKHFVLVFRVFRDNNFILFEDFDHHDRVYK